ncbi:acyltransferase [Hypoxylon fragiforme]|uniref:acyltransferase n=1 Tax=Hypoxylon fragiforme TaxID=63214 RepID=UPI0020C62655|nr:acyltransferase [Hypoxylon fragiforme]KAI2604052.1 acyltransferase [Hypoxylon fragiforme]
MPRKEEYRIHPWGWENDPEEESIRLSTLDYTSACVYNNYALYFKLEDGADREKVASILREGLEKTLAQARHLVGTIEKNDLGEHSFLKKKDSTVGFIVQYLNTPEDDFPSFAELEKAQFVSSKLGDRIPTLSWHGLTYGESPKCHPDAHPFMSAFQVNFIPGGLIFNMHSHHYANDIMGWAGFTHQLAEHCAAIVNQTPAPGWDPEAVQHTRFVAPDIAEEDKIDGPPSPDRYPHHEAAALLLHLSKSKAAELKKLATPPEGGWISTYDAYAAFLWRYLSKHRATIYNPAPQESSLWGEAVDMRRRLRDPVAPKRMQRNVFYVPASATSPTQLTNAEVISEAPLSKLAQYVRTTTTGMTNEALNKALDAVAPIRDKVGLIIRIDSLPPMTLIMTDWRDTEIYEADFGFGKPRGFRHLFATKVDEGLVIIYPPRPTGNPDEGWEFMIPYEKQLVKPLIEDPEFSKFFEFRGFEMAEVEDVAAP